MATDAEDIPRAEMSNLAIHPGELLGEELEARDLTHAAFAKMIGRPVQAVSAVVQGRKSITADLALDIEEALGIKAHIWTGLQMRHDLVLAKQARQRKEQSV